MSCASGVGQPSSEEAKKEAEFNELLKRAKSAQEINNSAIESANQESGKLIISTTKNIVSLKSEIKELKNELYEVSKKPDSVYLPDVDMPFQFFSTISSDKEDRQ
jgi:predicted  nucleic acid-binding Zn-ribbon protein